VRFWGGEFTPDAKVYAADILGYVQIFGAAIIGMIKTKYSIIYVFQFLSF
jgi:hypothetical protein